MKIFFLNAPPLKKIGVVGQIYPPLGILYLASYVKQRISAIEMRAKDGYNEYFETVIHDILDFKPDILAVSFTTQAATGAYEVINRIKAAQPDVLAVSGGAHPTIMAEEVLTKSRTDLVVVGEGEETFFEIVHNRLNKAPLDGIKGIVFNTGNRVRYNPLRPLIQNLDDIPFPDRSLLDLGQYPGYHYKKRAKDTSIVSARGCPYNCVYCSNPVWKVQKPWYRVRSPKNIVDEIVHIKETYGITEFYDETDEFNGKLSWAKQVCDEIIERDVDIAWKVQMRADKVDEELARKMKASGCWLAFFGIETGNDRTSRGVKKNISAEQVRTTLNIFKQQNIKVFALLMAFNVWEENGELAFEGFQETKNTLEFANTLAKENLIDLMSWSLTTPYPGSRLYEIARRHNLIDKTLP